MVRFIAAVISSLTLCLFVGSAPVHAADALADSQISPADDVGFPAPVVFGTGLIRDLPRDEVSAQRPAILPGLYVSFAALQVFDVYSTRQGLARGATEANPLVRGLAGNGVAFWSVKAATTAVSILLVERMWRDNKAGAIVAMVVANSIAATVAAHNVRSVGRLR